MPSLLLSAVAFAGVLGAVNSASLPRDYASSAGKAYLYFLQNDPNGSSIVAVDSDSKGKVTTVTSTEGKGASIFSSPGQIPTIDTLNTQGSVAVVDDVRRPPESPDSKDAGKRVLTCLDSPDGQCRVEHRCDVQDQPG